MVIAIALASVLTALPTERVMPEGRFPFVGNAAERIEVSLARNERESVQVVVDAEAARTVELIFSLRIQGLCNSAIADRLNSMGILSPMEYKQAQGLPAGRLD